MKKLDYKQQDHRLYQIYFDILTSLNYMGCYDGILQRAAWIVKTEFYKQSECGGVKVHLHK